MSDIAIRVANLGKQYHIGTRPKYGTLRDALTSLSQLPKRLLRRGEREDRFWALRDVSFEVKRGEVVGIIGRNGAGKSTLLKILSRITEPTEGEADLFGRVGSLLEVGTGFHPELTGRENIFLNGAILGMRRTEILKKFDEIVAFAEVEKFIDTPVKHFSSGMYMRLAFAVAAHLEPEILIVDEVLAVGDAQFQKKCLGKMGDVAKHGRTVLFVSHNMAAVQNLCKTGVLLAGGRVIGSGPIAGVVSDYLSGMDSQSGYETDLREHAGRVSRNGALIHRVRLFAADGRGVDTFASGERMIIEMLICPDAPITSPHIGIGINDQLGQRLFTVATYYAIHDLHQISSAQLVRCEIDSLPLAPGQYSITLGLGPPSDPTRDWLHHAVHFTVMESDYFESGKFPIPQHGPFLVKSRWSMAENEYQSKTQICAPSPPGFAGRAPTGTGEGQG